MATRHPATIGRYRITGELGRGGMGLVLAALDPALDRPVAIKLIRLEPDQESRPTPDLEQRFLREARVAARLAHPAIATVFDAGREGDVLYLVMELVPGESLARRLAEGRFPGVAEALEIAAQVADALAVAHAAGVVHRDIKPANILLAHSGQVKVSDFGVAKAIGESTELTRSGTVIGSPAYMAPEQIQGAEVDGRADLFSLGVVLYELLLRRRPFPADTVTTLIYQVLHRDPFEDGETFRALGPELGGFLRLALAKPPAARVADARTFARAVRELAAARPRAAYSDPGIATVALPGSSTPSGPGAAAAVAAGVAPAATGTGAPVLAPLAAVPPLGEERRAWLPAAVGAVLAAGILLLVLVVRSERGPQPPPSLAAANSPAPAAVSGPLVKAPARSAAPAAETAVPSAGAPDTAPADRRRDPPVPVAPPREPSRVPPARRAPPAEPPSSEAPEPAGTAGAVAAPALVPAPAMPTAEPSATFEARIGAEFNVSPEEAIVAVDGQVIGTADQWDGSGGGKVYKFPGPGTFDVRLSLPGYRTVHVRVVVRPEAEEKIADVDTELEEIE